MSAPADTGAEPGAAAGETLPRSAKRRRRRWALRAVVAMAALLVLLAGLAGGVRLFVRTDAGRRTVARLLEGVPLGPVGRLHVEGVGGDPFSDLTLARLQIVDARGPWLDARGLQMRWRARELLHRRFHAGLVRADALTILRDPVLAPQPPTRGTAELPVSVAIDRLRTRLETLPAFSVKRGLYDVDGGFTLARNMAAAGRLSAESRLHAGDGVHARFQLGEGGRMLIRAVAAEGAGGALAGALGLPVDRALDVELKADGSMQSGDMRLKATTGPDTPLVADAVWGGGRSRLTASLALGASRLTRDLAARAGPVARLTLAARHVQGDTFDLQGRLAADSASLALAGPLDWKVRRTSGLRLTLDAPDAARWAPGVAIASGRLEGVVAGDPERFDFKGAVAADRLAEGGYALARASGPVELIRAGDLWRLRADLTGAGGKGAGLLPALFGPAPRVTLDGSRLKDGRLMVSRLDARGDGLTLSGAGGQGFLGDLAFKGSAALSDLGRVRKGGRGRVELAWTATEPKTAHDWRFGLDARGTGFAIGVPAADSLIGPAPRLHGQASIGPDGLQVASATLDGAAASLTAKGRMDFKGGLGFDLGWRAEGPFQAGPLQVAGQASGTGRVGGTTAAPSVEVDSRIASLALGRLIVAPARLTLALRSQDGALGGQLALDGPSGYGPASLKAAFRVAGDRVEVRDLLADAGGVHASGSLALAGGQPASADLQLRAGPGAFLAAGRLNGAVRLAQAPGGLQAHLLLDGAGVDAPGLPGPIHAIRLKADGPLDHLPLQLTGDSPGALPWKLAATGRLDQVGAARVLTLSGSGEVRHVGLRTLRPAALRLDGEDRQLHLLLAVGGGRAEVDARQTSQALSGSAQLSAVDLATFEPDYRGALNAKLTVGGHGPTLGGVLDAALTGARLPDAPANLALDGRIHAVLGGQRLKVSASGTNAQGLKSNLDVDLPAVASAAPFRIAVDRTRPMSGDFSADGELRPLWDLLVGGDQRLAGRVQAQGRIAGTLAKPRLAGHASVADGRYQNYAVGLDLQKFALDADFGQELVRVGRLQGSDGRGGALSGAGDINLAPGGGSSFSMTLTRFRVIDTDALSATMSGKATVTRNDRGQAKLVGALKVDRADIQPTAPTPAGAVPMDVVEINKPGEPAGSAVPAAPLKPAVAPPLLLDVTVRASRGVFVKGKGLNVELSLDAHVGGSASAPDLSGEARVVFGSYDFAGKRFDFDSRSVVRLATRPQDIRLNLVATRSSLTASSLTALESKPTSATAETGGPAGTAAAGLTAEVHVTGTAARPEITLTSYPVLPQDEVLSQVLFGSSAAQLTGAQAAELASTLASLSGGGGFDVLGRLRSFAGLDRLAFGQGASGTGVSGGKYVTDSVYIELTGGGREGPSASVEWRVLKNFSVISSVGTQGDAQLSIQYNTTFGRGVGKARPAPIAGASP